MTLQQAKALVTLTDLIAAGRLDGYAPGKPPGMHPACVAIDREAAAQWACPVCGHAGGQLRQFHSTRPGHYSYVALARCPIDGHCEEF